MRQRTGQDEVAGPHGEQADDGNAEIQRVIAEAVSVDTGQQEVLIEYARRLGPDPSLAALDAAALERQVRDGAAAIAAATCQWLQYVAEFVVRGDWADQGARTPAAWLSWAVGMAPSTAREHLRVALRLRELPLVRERFAAGRISYSKVRAVTRVAGPETEELLLTWADAAPAHVLERIVSDARRLRDVPAEDDDSTPSMTLRRGWSDDGCYELVLRVDAATGLQVEAYLDRLVEVEQAAGGDAPIDAEDEANGEDAGSELLPQPSRSQREAELVVGALGAAVRAAPDDTSGADRHLVVLHATVGELLAASPSSEAAASPRGASSEASKEAIASRAGTSGEPVASPTSASAEARCERRAVLVRGGRGRPRAMSARHLWRWACNAGLTLSVDREDGHPADLGRARRLPDARLRRLLHARDRTCRFPGCGAVQFLHAHHVVHWAEGGPTDLDNLVLLCGFHHRLVHSDGWTMQSAGSGRWTFHRDGRQQRWARPLRGASAEAAIHAAARVHADDLDPVIAGALLQPMHWDGDYDHELAVEVLANRLAAAA